jgi:hypothetical protein
MWCFIRSTRTELLPEKIYEKQSLLSRSNFAVREWHVMSPSLTKHFVCYQLSMRGFFIIMQMFLKRASSKTGIHKKSKKSYNLVHATICCPLSTCHRDTCCNKKSALKYAVLFISITKVGWYKVKAAFAGVCASLTESGGESGVADAK